MKSENQNMLNSKTRKLLQWGVVLMLGVFLVGYYMFMRMDVGVQNTSVYLQDEVLYVFDEEIKFEGYPDRLSMRYPYLLIVQPELQKTLIYDLEDMKLEKEVDEVSLDYFNGMLLFNKGSETYLDDQNLGTLCEQGVIKSASEVLCVTTDSLSGGNSILSINVSNKESSSVYSSLYLITDISLIDGNLYVGEIDPETNVSYIVIDGESLDVPSSVNMIYQLGGKPHFATFRGALNPKQESYYKIENDQTALQSNSKIVFYK